MADDSPSTMRACRKCGEEKPATSAYFQPYGSQRQLRWTCKLCRGAKSEGQPVRLRERISDDERRERNRVQCKAYYERNREAQLAKFRAYRRQHPEKFKEHDRRNTLKNKAPGSAYQKRKYAALDRGEARERLKAWRDANPDRVRAHWERTYAKNKAKHHARALRWIANNRDKTAAMRDRRRAWKAAADGSYGPEDVARLLDEAGRVCFYCAAPLDTYHVDHFIPLSRGGSNWPENLRLSCPACNCSKSAKMPWEWMPSRFPAPDGGGPSQAQR